MKRLAALPRQLSRSAVNLFGGNPKTAPWLVETPTTAIYFTNVFRDLIDRPIDTLQISRLEANAFHVHGKRESTVIFRYASPSLMRSLQSSRRGRLLYVLDDNIAAGVSDEALPADYRSRLLSFQRRTVQPICKMADEVIAPSQFILDSLGVAQTSLIAPSLIHDLPSLEHHNEDAVRIVFNGTRSHLSDFRMIVPVLRHIIEKHENVYLTTFLGSHAPAELAGKRVTHLPPMRWEDYRRYMRKNCFHIALGPARETLFNLARSPSRILDNAGFGAVGVYSARKPFNKWVVNGETGLLLSDSNAHWTAGLESLIADRSLRKTIAKSAAKLAVEIGNASRLKQFWAEKLDLDLGDRSAQSAGLRTELFHHAGE
jgi:hypothetical protein